MALVAVFAWRQLRDALKTLHRSCGTVGCALFVIFAIATSVVAQKGTNAPAANPPRMMTGLRPAVSPIEVDATNFPTNFPTVTNLCFWYIYKFADSVDLGLAWPNGTTFENNLLDVFLNYELSSNHWDKVASVDVSAASSNLIVNLDAALLATNGASAFFRAATQTDADGDGLSDAEERWTYHTDPANPDSDGDNLCDGWEIKYGLDPSVANDEELDSDHDLLNNHWEALLGTDPQRRDTDGDGKMDGIEVPVWALYGGRVFAANAPGLPAELPTEYAKLTHLPELSFATDPLDANDGDKETVGIGWGDPSTSLSEKYIVRIEPVSGSGMGTLPRGFSSVNSSFGGGDTNIAFLARGWRYALTLSHSATRPDRNEPDYDYVLALAADTNRVSVYDPEDILRVSSVTDGVFFASGKTAEIVVLEKGVTNCVSVTIDGLKSGAVLMHDAYTNAPGEVYAFTSTVARLKVRVNAPVPGTVTLSAIGADGRVVTSETLPKTWTVNGVSEREITITGFAPSDAENDITFTATFNGRGFVGTDSASMTAIKITSVADSDFPENKGRHVFGPAEITWVVSIPVAIDWTIKMPTGVNKLVKKRKKIKLSGPFVACEYGIESLFRGVGLFLEFRVINPQREEACDFWPANEVSDWGKIGLLECPTNGMAAVGMVTQLKLAPEYVSFDHVEIMELETEPIHITGWYTNVVDGCCLADKHDILAGANVTNIVMGRNVMLLMDYAMSIARSDVSVPKWTDGSFEWDISCAWHVADDDQWWLLNKEVQVVSINSNGTMQVEKFDHAAIRETNSISRIIW